jgi:hypothetical protein
MTQTADDWAGHLPHAFDPIHNADPSATDYAPPAAAMGGGATLSPAERDPFLDELLGKLSKLPSGLRQSLADQLWASIPSIYWESGNLASALSVNSTPRQESPVQITTIVASVPAGATGSLQLADVVLYLGPGLSVVPFGDGAGIVLARSDTRSLTVTAAGPVSLLLAGKVLPTTGILS